MKYNSIIDLVIKDVRRDVLPELPLTDFEVREINSKRNYLGFYKNGSCFNTVLIKLNKPQILQGANESKLSIYDVILTTILHELAHAIQELKGLWCDEEQAENFAITYWDWRIIDEIK